MKLIGVSTAVCEISGRWSSNPPQCLGKFSTDSITHFPDCMDCPLNILKSLLPRSRGGSRGHSGCSDWINNPSRRKRDP